MACDAAPFSRLSIEQQKLNRFLKDDRGLPLLLYSEVLKKTKNFDKLKTTYNEMLNIQTTKELGEIGLMEYYLSLQDYHHALVYAEKLFYKNRHHKNLRARKKRPNCFWIHDCELDVCSC